MRRAGAEDARRSRARQGLPERIEDPVTAAALAALLRDPPRPAPQTSRPSRPAPTGTSGIIPHARSGQSVEDEEPGGNQHLDPSDDATKRGKAPADGLAGRDDRSRPSGAEGLFGSLPLVLAVGTPAQ